MKSNYKLLGQFIRQVDVRNTDCAKEIYAVDSQYCRDRFYKI